jgi:ribosome maturation factor RimP
MISTESIHSIVSQILENTECFVVEVSVKPGNRIFVFADKLEGITIDECAEISREIEKHLDRDVEDYELEVSSPGLTLPFRVKQQYFKNIGNDLEIIFLSGEKITGKLLSMSDSSINVEAAKKVKTPGKKRPEVIMENITIEFKNIKSTKVLINF